MSDPLRVLIIEDSALDAKVLVGLLQNGGYEIDSERVETAPEFSEAIQRRPWDIILADYTVYSFFI